MKNIVIKNIGPISFVDVALNKVNILMGPQSSGKSTIAKIISYCQWVEKRYILDGNYEYNVSDQLLNFHRLGKSYFSEGSFFEYETDFIKISYTGVDLIQSITTKDSVLEFKKSKNIYIPSERNFVSVIPNLSKYKETNDNIMNFVYDWYTAKRKFTKTNMLPILNLGVNFFHQEENDLDMLILNKNQTEIQLRESSSGLQSLTPLTIIIEYLTNNLYKEKPTIPVNEREGLEKYLSAILKSDVIQKIKDKDDKQVDIIADKITQRIHYNHSNLIIEEPEQNLFPETQRDFIYYILEKIKIEKDHSLIITTHSPYILYAINNCIIGALISGIIPQELKDELPSKNSWLAPDLVNIFEIDKEKGTLNSIKDNQSGTVSKHYFNKVMNGILDEYYEMLNFLEYEG